MTTHAAEWMRVAVPLLTALNGLWEEYGIAPAQDARLSRPRLHFTTNGADGRRVAGDGVRLEVVFDPEKGYVLDRVEGR